MSKKTQEKKEAAAKEKTAPKGAVPNGDRCCHCKHYSKIPKESGHMCKQTGKPTPRKATCSKQEPKTK